MKKPNIILLLLMVLACLAACHKDKEMDIKEAIVSNEEISVSATQARLSWQVEFAGQFQTGVEVSQSENMADLRRVEASKEEDKFVAVVDSLTEGKKYYYRIVVWNKFGSYEEIVKDFTTAKTFSIHVEASEGGTATGGGTFAEGDTCTVVATANVCYNFVNWTENGSQVSAEAEYSFAVTGNRSLVANFTSQEYTITATAEPEEGGTVNGSGGYNNGDECTLTATANEGYEFLNWTKEDGTIVSLEPVYAFNVTETAAFVAHFQIKSYTITIVANPDNGGTVDGGGTYEYGQSCTVYATEANGYHFVNWTENDGQVSSSMEYTFIVTGDRDLVANFSAEDYIISVEIEPENGGTVIGAGGYNYGDECTLKATANEGYDFVNWTKEDGTVVSADATYSFTVTESASFVAHFQIRSYTVTVSAHPNNGGSVYVGNTPGATQGTYNSGQYCTVNAIANSGYRFANWTENDSVVANYATYNFHVTSNRELVANFTRVYTINVSANPTNGGTVTGSGFYEEGETCRVTAAANPNFTFVNWMDGSQVASTQAEYTFTVTGNRTLVAHFEPQAGNYTISVSANPTNGGLVHVGSPTGPTTGTYNSGQSCTIYATANEHYTFTNWKKGNSVVSTNSTYTFQVTESATYTAYFTQDPQYTITASANPTNGGSVSGGGTYYQGETCNLTATAASNYSFDHWTRNGTTISGGTTISFNVTENATYIAYFITVPTVTTNNATNIQQTTATGGGNVTNSGGATVTRRGVCWSTSQNPSLDNGSSYQDASSGGTGTFTVPMTGLTPGTHYYVRAYATNSAGTGYGSQEEFDTQAQQYTISVSANPSNGGTVTGGGTFNQGQQCTVHANPNGNYTFTNWTENGSVASMQANYTFTVTGNRTLVANFTSNSGNHAYVDLGLPSGLLWATCNVGADNPEDYGDYFAWGETQPKSVYNWSTYQYCMGSENTLTKYCNNASYGYNGFTDNLTILELGDDAATVNWGGNWHMPTEAEWEELRNNTTVTWTPQNGVNGCRFTASNGNSIFLPAAGYRYESGLIGAGSNGHYWSSSLINTLDPNTPDYARDLFFYYSVYDGVEYYIVYHTRMCGRSVRPVRSARQD